MGLSTSRRAAFLASAGLTILAAPSWAAAQAPTAAAPLPVQVAQAGEASPQTSSTIGQATTPMASSADTVVVTAERRTTNLQTTPLSISAISAAALDQSYVTQLSDLSAKVPGLEITHQSGFENAVTIRGVGYATPENSPTNTPGVAEFVDGVYIANTISLDETLFDVDHVEVLRGPQGALYGESADGGAISIVTRQPRLRVYDASGDASFGDYDLFRERAEVNVPLGDQVAVRLSAQAYDHSGFTQNLAIPQNRLDDNHDMSGKLAILWKPNAAFSATLTGMVYHSDQNGAAQKNIIESDPAVLAAFPQLSDPRKVYQDYPATFDLTAQLYHLNLEWDLPGAIVKSVTAYQQLDHVQQEDGSRSAYAVTSLLPGGGFYDDVAAWNTKLQNYNEELDILSPPGARFEWDVGAFVQVSDISQFVTEFADRGVAPNSTPNDLITGVPANVETNPPYNVTFGQLADTNRQDYAGFVQGTYHLTSHIRLTGGVRVNHDSYTPADFDFSGKVGGGEPVYTYHDDSLGYSDTVPTFRAEADYDVTPMNLVYGSISRGYKPGGVNNNGEALVVPHTFQYETNTAYEVGSKNTFLDRALKLDLAAFYYDYDNFQYVETDPIPFNYGTANIPAVHIYGFEGEGGYTSPDHRLQVNATLSLESGFGEGSLKTIDTSVINATTSGGACFAGAATAFFGAAGAGCISQIEAGAIPINGKHVPDLPRVAGSVNASYVVDTPYGKLIPYAEFIYRGEEEARVFNDPVLDRIGSYGVWNFNLQYLPQNTHVKLSLAVTNAFDRDGVNSRYTDPYGTGQTSQQFIPPRQVIGTVAFAF